MRTPQLLLFFLLVCQTTENLNDKRVNLGQNVTLDCQIGFSDVFWVFQKLPDSPVLILRTFTSTSTKPHIYDERFKDKYSSLTLARLFISNVTIDELGIYYCVKAATSLEFSNGIRLSITEAAGDQNQTEVNKNSQGPKTPQTLIVLYVILNIVMFLAIIGLLQIKLQLCKKKHEQCQDEELYSFTARGEEFSAVEFRLSTNNTFGKRT